MIEGLKGATRQSSPSLTGDSNQTVESMRYCRRHGNPTPHH